MKFDRKKFIEFMVLALVALAVIVAGRFIGAADEDDETAATPVGSAFSSNQRVAPASDRGNAIRVVLSRSERSEPIRVGSHQCIQWWDETSGDTEFLVEVSGFDGTEWIANEEFNSLKNAGTAPYNFPAWYRFVGNQDRPANISYQILRGLCPS